MLIYKPDLLISKADCQTIGEAVSVVTPFGIERIRLSPRGGLVWERFGCIFSHKRALAGEPVCRLQELRMPLVSISSARCHCRFPPPPLLESGL